MTKTPNPWFVALDDGLTVPVPGTGSHRYDVGRSRVLSRGHEVELTEAFIEATRDRYGDSPWSGGVPDEPAQVARWGRVRVLPGRLADHPELVALIERETDERLEAERVEAVRLAARHGAAHQWRAQLAYDAAKAARS